MSDVTTWLQALGLGKYAEGFVAQDVTVDLLPDLTDADLRDLGVTSLGDRKRILKAIAAPSTSPAEAAAPAPAPRGATQTDSPPPAAEEEGERRQATVVFSDLTGYTALNEAFDPEEVEAVMTRIKREASAVIERHGGRVNQFVGDEIMSVFGVPVARGDDARRAVDASLELHRRIDAIAAEVAARLGRRLSMHSGIQTGLVVARRSDARAGDFTLTGDTVNTAARLRSLAQPGEVVVSAQTWQQVSEHFEGIAGAPVAVRGKEKPLVPYRVLGTRLASGAVRPLIGRHDEMRQLEALADACRQRRRGRVALVRGDPGLGKSRLVAELLQWARSAGLASHATSILDFGARTGHDAMRRLILSVLGLPDDAEEADREQALIERCGTGAEGDASPYAFDLLDVTPPAAVRSFLAGVDTATRQRGTLDALARLLCDPAGEPMLVLVEDVHCADAPTLQQLGVLAAATATQPLLLVLTTRFAGDPSAGGWRAALHGLPVTGIDLGPLPAEDAFALAGAVASIPEGLLRICVERAEGNPLFLEQLILNAGEEAVSSMPGSVQALVQARMDRLAPADKAALQAAAVWGQRAPLEAVRHLIADPSWDERALVDHFLLRRERDELVFSHALIRDGAYASLLHARRRQLHQVAAEWIEPRDAALAAEHYGRAEDDRAATAYLRATEELERAFKPADALILVDRALALPRAAGEPFELHLARARLLLELGRSADALEAGRVAVEAARDGADRARALIAIGGALRILDRSEEGLAAVDEAQPLAEAAMLSAELGRLHLLRGNLYFLRGRPADSQPEYERALALARAAGSAEAECEALGGMGDARQAVGKIRSAHAVFERCLELAHAHGWLRVEAAYLPMSGWTNLFQMDLAASMARSAACIELARRIARLRPEMIALGQRAIATGWLQGDVTSAMRDLEAAQQIANTLGTPRFQTLYMFYEGLLETRRGRMDEAREVIREGLTRVGSSEGFAGPQLHGCLARVETDPELRIKALADGEAIVRRGALSHSRFFFADAAIQVSLDDGRWDAVEHHCALLEEYVRDEPFAWSEFITARARALSRAGQGETGEALRGELEALRRRAIETAHDVYVAGIDAALAMMGSS